MKTCWPFACLQCKDSDCSSGCQCPSNQVCNVNGQCTGQEGVSCIRLAVLPAHSGGGGCSDSTLWPISIFKQANRMIHFNFLNPWLHTVLGQRLQLRLHMPRWAVLRQRPMQAGALSFLYAASSPGTSQDLVGPEEKKKNQCAL